MATLADKVKGELEALTSEGFRLLKEGKTTDSEVESSASKSKKSQTLALLQLNIEYQKWYTKSSLFVKQMVPDRYQEFVDQYSLPRRKTIDAETYTISDYLAGLSISRNGREILEPAGVYRMRMLRQVAILQSAESRINSLLSDVQGILQAQVFDGELDAASNLLKNGHLRAAGAVAGVVLEGHLKRVCTNHGVAPTKKGATINDFNEALKKEGIIDVPNWRHIQLLADYRNYCCHPKERDPREQEVADLIEGTKKIVSTVF